MENEPMQVQQPQVKPKGAHNLVWVLLFIVALAAGGATWWWQYSQTQSVQKQLSAEQDAVTAAQKNAANLQAEVATLKADPGTVVTKDTDLILAATDAYVRAPVAAASEKFTYDVKDNTSKFAKVSVGVSTGGGYSVTLKKVDNNWTVLFAGQDLPGKDVGEKYGLPETYYQK